jgi:hypothetical protein
MMLLNTSAACGIPNIQTSDLDEIKARGYVGVYKGVPIVLLTKLHYQSRSN